MAHLPIGPRRSASLVLGALTVAAFAAACSSSGSSHETARHTLTPAVHTAHSSRGADQPTPSETSPTQARPAHAVAPDLSGSWSGQYRGDYSGTFHLRWHEHGTRLVGTITLSSPASTNRLTGTVKGGAITFGTVGSQAVTYSGTISDSSMSGAYQVAGRPSGSWSATKSS